MISRDYNSISNILNTFSEEQICIKYLEKLRWNDNVVSPFDPTSKVYKCKNNKYRCKNTGKYFNVKTNTLFDNTRIELRKWFVALFIIIYLKKNITSAELAKEIDVTQKTAWFMLKRINNCF